MGRGMLAGFAAIAVLLLAATYEGIYPTNLVVNVQQYGAVANGTTDCTTAVNNALTALSTGGGGTLFFPQGTYRVTGQIILPNDGGNASSVNPKQVPIKLLGTGASVFPVVSNGGSTINLTYSGTWGKILTMGTGVLEIAGLTLTDSAGTTTPYIYDTNTTLNIHDTSFHGLLANGGTACAQDALVLGTTSNALPTYTSNPNNIFQGYGTVIERCTFNAVRRAVYCRYAANGIIFKDNHVESGCGSNIAGGAAIELDYGNYGSTFDGNVIEVPYYTYGVKVGNSGYNTFTGNGFYDASVSTSGCFTLGASSSRTVITGGHTFLPVLTDSSSGSYTLVTGNNGVAIGCYQAILSPAGGGTIIVSQPFQGPNYKEVVLYFSAATSLANNPASYTYQTAFAYPPVVDNPGNMTISTTATTGSITVTCSNQTGFIKLEGF
jgi:Pectate lyase superfamily protein